MTGSTNVDPMGLVRAVDNLWRAGAADRDSKLLLGGRPPRYWSLGPQTVMALDRLAMMAEGITVRDFRAAYPHTNLQHLIRAQLVHYVPPSGLAVRPALVGELWRRNIEARRQLAARGWRAVDELMGPSVQRLSAPTCIRPLLLDEVEAAARASFSLPGSSRKCTVVARATCQALRSRGLNARVAILVSLNQSFMHARVIVNGQHVDPGNELLEGEVLKPLYSRDDHLST